MTQFTAAETPSLAKWNEILAEAGEIVTSSSRPVSPVDGQYIFETDTRKVMRWSTAAGRWEAVSYDGAWDAWSPTLAQGPGLTVTLSFNVQRWCGRMYQATAKLAISSAGTAANAFVLPLTVDTAHAPPLGPIGTWVYDDIGAGFPSGIVVAATVGVAQFFTGTSPTSAFGVAPAVTAASGDSMYVSLSYYTT